MSPLQHAVCGSSGVCSRREAHGIWLDFGELQAIFKTLYWVR